MSSWQAGQRAPRSPPRRVTSTSAWQCGQTVCTGRLLSLRVSKAPVRREIVRATRVSDPFLRAVKEPGYHAPVDDRRALETYISLAHRLTRATPFDGGAGELCGKLALLAGARALALFEVRPGGSDLVLMGAYGLPAEYVKRYPPRIARTLARMPGDIREALQRGHTVRIDGLTDDPRTVSLTGVALAARLHASVTIPLVQEGDVLGILHAFYADAPDARRLALLDGAAPLVLNALTMQRLRARLGQGYGEVAETDASHLFGPAHATRHLKQVHAVAERYEQRYALVTY